MGQNTHHQKLGDSPRGLNRTELRPRSYIDLPIAVHTGTRQGPGMSLNLQNDVARRLQRAGSRQAVVASPLFGRSCRLLDPRTAGDRSAGDALRRVERSR
jgi:hypothetical protein